MYIFSLIRKSFTRNNWPILVFLVLNILAGAGLMLLLVAMFDIISSSSEPFDYAQIFGVCLIISSVLYLISIIFTVSPLGEWITRLRYKCQKIQRTEQINKMESLYAEAYERAKAMDASLPSNIRMYVTESPETNVFALGRKTITVTTGIFSFPEEKTKALLSRELGHISQKDTDFLLLVSTGNVVVTGVIWIIRLFLYACMVPVMLFGAVLSLGLMLISLPFGGKSLFDGIFALGKPASGGVMFICKKLFSLINWLGRTMTNAWSWVGVKMVMTTRKNAEFVADEFAFNCGYGDILCDIIQNDNLADENEGLFRQLIRAYPSADKRLAKLEALGAGDN